MYYVFFPRDKRWIKVLVYSIFLLELAQTTMRAIDAYINEVVHWGDYDFVGTHLGHRGDTLTWFSMPVLSKFLHNYLPGVRAHLLQFQRRYRVELFKYILDIGSTFSPSLFGSLPEFGW
jgi:hypothetical protein